MPQNTYPQENLLAFHDMLEDLMENTRALSAISDGEERAKLEKLARQLSGLVGRCLDSAFKLSSDQLGEAVRKLSESEDLIAQANRDVERTAATIESLSGLVESLTQWMPA